MPPAYEEKKMMLRLLWGDQGGKVDLKVPIHLRCAFYFRMPKNWSKKRKREMMFQPCLKKPDLDNCLGAVMDAILDKDSNVYRLEGSKVWHDHDGIIIELIAEAE